MKRSAKSLPATSETEHSLPSGAPGGNRASPGKSTITTPSIPDSSIPRKRGAPPGNHNAIKHGFYSRRFRNLELGDLEVMTASLFDEITGLRVAARRVLEYSDVLGEDPMKAIQALNYFGMLCTRIANLARTHAALTGNTDETQTAISTAISRVAEILNLKGPS